MNETILARQPTKGFAPKKYNIEKIRKRFQQLLNKREPYLKKWKEIRDYELPFIGIFDNEEDLSKSHTKNIYNGTTWESCQIFAAGVMSGLTPPSRQWFKLSMANSQLSIGDPVSRILDERQRILTDVFAKSNFYNAVFTVYMELPFGQAPMGIFKDTESGVRFIPYTVGTYAMESGANGKINTFVRQCKMTADQIVEQFGLENCPQNVQNSYTNNQGTQNYIVNWYVDRNPEAIDKQGNKKMPYQSIYWVDGSSNDEYLYIGGFEEWPIPVARHTVMGLEAYGKGAGWFSLDDARMLQKLEFDHLTAVEISVKPPMQAPADLIGRVNLFPGGITENDTNGIVQPLFNIQSDMPSLMNKIQEVEGRIKRYYSADLFLMLDSLDNGSMTAREVMERTQEKLQQLGPVVERLLSEFLDPIIERTYNILDRAGVFPPIPDELTEQLNGQDIKIDYISPLAQAQKMSSLVNIEQIWAFITTLGQVDPSIFQKFDMVQAVNTYAENLGAPAPVIRSDEDYQALIQQMQKAQQEQEAQAQQMAMMQQAPGMAQAAKVATDAANDGNPALQDWLGMGGG